MSVSNEVLPDVQGLEKAYGGNQVLNGITTQIRRGEVVAIIGPSGCGKSTFLRSLNLLEEPTGGKILFEGTDITDSKVDINRHRQKIGMVFQSYDLFPHMTVMKNITLAPLKVQNRSRDEVTEKAMSLLKRVGLDGKADSYPSELSGGQKQRVAIARAMINDPAIILADEPTGNLDSKSGDVVIHTLSHINRELGKTIVMVTHDPKMASYCSRLILLKDGMILEDMRNGVDQEAFYQEILGKMKEL